MCIQRQLGLYCQITGLIVGKETLASIGSPLHRTARAPRADVVGGGNRGQPLTDGAEGAGLAVLELSSFQLERSGDLPLRAATIWPGASASITTSP